jgi:hypothetical protein
MKATYLKRNLEPITISFITCGGKRYNDLVQDEITLSWFIGRNSYGLKQKNIKSM